MGNINDILGFHFNAEIFAKMGNQVIGNDLITEVENKISELHEVSNQIEAIGSGVDKSIDIEDILRKINSRDHLPELSVKELRTLCYYLSEIKSDDALIDTLLHLDEKWKNSFFLGLIDYVFQFWNPLSSKFCNVRDFLKDKLNGYDGTNPRYIFLRDNIKCLDDNGPVSLGAKLKINHKSILSCTEYLGFPEQKITYNYFSDVIYTYYKYKFTDNVPCDELAQVLNLHNNSLTDKSVLPLFITQNKGLAASRKEALENLSKLRIGDCENNAKWSLPVEIESERHEILKEAQNVIRFWTNEKYITIFFEKFVNEEPQRKMFWLNYIKEINRIRIVGSKIIEQKMGEDQRLLQLLQGKFILATNTMSTVSAIIMQIRDKVYIEFSENGNALYVYDKEHLSSEKVFSCKSIHTITDLKQTYLGMLIEIKPWGEYHNEYGRLFHKGDWQSRLTHYISKH